MKLASKCRLDQMFLTINWLPKEYAIKDLFGIIVMVNVSVINHVILEIFKWWKLQGLRKN